MVHILFRATIDGSIVRGPMIGTGDAFVLAADWLGGRKPRPLPKSRLLGAFGPLLLGWPSRELVPRLAREASAVEAYLGGGITA